MTLQEAAAMESPQVEPFQFLTEKSWVKIMTRVCTHVLNDYLLLLRRMEDEFKQFVMLKNAAKQLTVKQLQT